MERLEREQILPLITGVIGAELEIYDTVGSTNDTAKLLAKNGAPHGAAVFARQQTAGKGRQGRSFFSPEGAGIYLSVILRPNLPAAQALMITPAAAVAVSRAIARETGISVKIKWVNDLYLDGRKICGILAESALAANGMLDYAVLGIGVNLTEANIPPELSEIVGALSRHKSGISPNCLAAAILNELDAVCAELESCAFLEEYRARSCVLGKTVTLVRGTETQQAVAESIDDGARLLARLTDGSQITVECGEISLKGDWR